MIMITSKQFFRAKIGKNLLFLFVVLHITACSKNQIFKAESFKTTSGWGYIIYKKNKIIIKQSIIPVINDTKSFSTKKDAVKVANLVVQKLKEHNLPTVTKNDLILLKIKI